MALPLGHPRLPSLRNPDAPAGLCTAPRPPGQGPWCPPAGLPTQACGPLPARPGRAAASRASRLEREQRRRPAKPAGQRRAGRAAAARQAATTRTHPLSCSPPGAARQAAGSCCSKLPGCSHAISRPLCSRLWPPSCWQCWCRTGRLRPLASPTACSMSLHVCITRAWRDQRQAQGRQRSSGDIKRLLLGRDGSRGWAQGCGYQAVPAWRQAWMHTGQGWDRKHMVQTGYVAAPVGLG